MFSRSVMNQMNLCSLNARAFPGSEDSPTSKSRRIIVSKELPVKMFQDSETGRRSFELDSDSVYVKLRDGFEAGTEVIHVGTLTSVDVDSSDESEVEAELEKLGCVPVFLEREKREDESHRRAYVKANQIFANTINSIINPDSDYVWVHDYNLMILPTLIRRKFHRVRVGLFLHSLSEISRDILSGAEILNSLLNCNLVGFSSLDNARNFLSGCTRILGRCEWSSKLGCIVLDHHGRSVEVKITDSANWARSFDAELSRVCRDNKANRICGTGFGLGFRVVALPPEIAVGSYGRRQEEPAGCSEDEQFPERVSMLDSLCN